MPSNVRRAPKKRLKRVASMRDKMCPVNFKAAKVNNQSYPNNGVGF
jgi:hypothetical protein